MEPKTIVLTVVITIIVLALIALAYWANKYYAGHKKVNRETQRFITDYAILELIESQPDGLLDAKGLAAVTELDEKEALRRLMMLHTWGVLYYMHDNWSKIHFSLRRPLDRREPPALSAEPFLTVDDIVRLFRHHDFRLTPQDLVTSTRLPANVLQREMKYFQREKVVQQLYSHDPNSGTVTQKFYVLREPYRSNPEAFLEKGANMDLQLKELLRNEDLL